MTLHAVPNQHLHLFPIFYTLWSPPTIHNTLLKLLQLNLYWEGPVMQVHSNNRRPFSVLPKPFMWVDLFFENYPIMLKAPPPSTTSLKESSVKNQFSKLIPTLHSKTVCVNEFLGGICREEKIPDLSQADTSYYQIHKIQPITKRHVLLLDFAITTQKPTEICQVSCKN